MHQILTGVSWVWSERVRYDRTKQEMRIPKLVYGSSDVYKMSIIKGGAVSNQVFHLSKAG